MVFTSIVLALFNIYLFLRILALKSKIKKQKHEIEMFMKLHSDAQRAIRDEANKNIILQSLINQRQKV